MSAPEFFAYAQLLGTAFLFACGLVLVQIAFVDLENRSGRWLLPALAPLMLLSIMLSTAMSGRSLRYVSMDIRSIGGDEGGGGNLLRLFTGLILALSFAKILGVLARRGVQRGPTTTAQRSGPALMVFIAMIAFYVTNVLMPSALGKYPSFQHNALYPLVVFVAVYLGRHDALSPLIAAAKFTLTLMMLGSLALAALKPDLALQPDYKGWIPGFDQRLWGLGSNANSIGPLALALMLLELLQPSRTAWGRALVWASALAVLLLAQSKTTWVAAVLVAGVLALVRSNIVAAGRLRPGVVLALLAAALMASWFLLTADFGAWWDRLGRTQVGTDISTLTGRTQIWAMALETFSASPWFGYGLEAWGPLHRYQLGMPFAFHAHNQFLQSLSVGGLFAGVCVLLYFGTLWVAAFAARERTRGVSLAFMALITLRFFSEAPLELRGLFIGETVMHLLLFAILVHTAPGKEPADRS